MLNGVSVMLFRFVPREFSSLYICFFFGLSSLGLLAYRLATRRSVFYKSNGLYVVSALSAISQCVGIVLTILALDIAAKSSSQAGLIVFPITNGLPNTDWRGHGQPAIEAAIESQGQLGCWPSVPSHHSPHYEIVVRSGLEQL